MQVAVLIGPPASGKGTHSKFLESLGFFHFSSGDYIRERIAEGDPNIDPGVVAAGGFAADNLVAAEVARVIDLKQQQGFAGITLDGFPRNVRQAELLSRMLAERGLSPIVIELKATAATLEAQRAKRVAAAFGQGEPPRKDDEPAVFAERQRRYDLTTAPALDTCRAAGMTVYEIDANQPQAAKQDRLRQLLAKAPVLSTSLYP